MPEEERYGVRGRPTSTSRRSPTPAPPSGTSSTTWMPLGTGSCRCWPGAGTERRAGAARAGGVHAEEPARLRPGREHPDVQGRWTHMGSGSSAIRSATTGQTLLWFANQRAVEYHPTLVPRAFVRRPHTPGPRPRPGWLALMPFERAVQGAFLVRQALSDVGMAAVAKTSGAKAVHVVVLPAPGRRRRTSRPPPGLSRPAPSASTPKPTTTAFVVGGSGRQGLPRRDAGGWGDRGRWLTVRGSGPVSRCRSRWAWRTSLARRRPTSPSPPCRGCSATPTPG